MRTLKPLALIMTLIITLGLSSCGSTKKKSSGGAPGDPNVTGTDNNMGSEDYSFELNGDSDSNKAGALRTVYFAFDSSSLNSSTRSALQTNAKFLKENSDAEVQIEGHCDERGGHQYNLALGQKRAKAVRQYLVNQGVKSSQMSTISFGKERPVSFGHDESSWSRNRRANFVVTKK
jgi:peptidoglycan-associated lipoprotein